MISPGPAASERSNKTTVQLHKPQQCCQNCISYTSQPTVFGNHLTLSTSAPKNHFQSSPIKPFRGQSFMTSLGFLKGAVLLQVKSTDAPRRVNLYLGCKAAQTETPFLHFHSRDHPGNYTLRDAITCGRHLVGASATLQISTRKARAPSSRLSGPFRHHDHLYHHPPRPEAPQQLHLRGGATIDSLRRASREEERLEANDPFPATPRSPTRVPPLLA